MNFLDEMEKVVKSFRGNVHKFQNFPNEFEWARDTWRKSSSRTQPPRVKLKPDSTQKWGLEDALAILKTQLRSAWLSHPRWEVRKKL